jgi:hypothetical protein
MDLFRLRGNTLRAPQSNHNIIPLDSPWEGEGDNYPDMREIIWI